MSNGESVSSKKSLQLTIYQTSVIITVLLIHDNVICTIWHNCILVGYLCPCQLLFQVVPCLPLYCTSLPLVFFSLLFFCNSRMNWRQLCGQKLLALSWLQFFCCSLIIDLCGISEYWYLCMMYLPVHLFFVWCSIFLVHFQEI